jgi:hypothetical protein
VGRIEPPMYLGDERKGVFRAFFRYRPVDPRFVGGRVAVHAGGAAHEVANPLCSLLSLDGLVVTFVPKVPFWKFSDFKALRSTLWDHR